MDKERLLALLDAYADGRMSPEEQAELEDLLTRSEEARGLFWDSLAQHALTRELVLKARGQSMSASVLAGLGARKRVMWAFGLAAAGLLLGLGVFLVGRGSEVVPERASPTPVQAQRSKERPSESPRPPEPETPRPEAPRNPTAAPQEGSARPETAVRPPTPKEVPPAPAPNDKPRAEPERKITEPGPAPAPARPDDALPPAPPPPPVRLEGVRGQVFVIAGTTRTAAKAGQAVSPGQGLETAGTASKATLRFADATRLELWGETTVSRVADTAADQGKRVLLSRGVLAVEVVRQPDGRPMLVATPVADALVVGTRFKLAVDPQEKDTTRLVVDEGNVRLTRSADGKAVDVPGGHFAVAAAAEVSVQEFKKVRQEEARVDAAIRTGVKYLQANNTAHLRPWRREEVNQKPPTQYAELVLWTYVHAGVPESDPDFKHLFNDMMARKLEATYCVSLQAMILEELDRVKYQPRIAQCAQFLVDNQCKNGQWSYGEPSLFVDDVRTGGKRGVETPGRDKARAFEPLLSSCRREKPKVVNKVVIKKKRELPIDGDNSNSQYAALGLRACHDAGIVFSKDFIELSLNWWQSSIKDDTHPQFKTVGRGWGYHGKYSGGEAGAGYGSMTAGAAGSVAICHYILNQPWTKDPAFATGVKWMAENFSVTYNPGPYGVPANWVTNSKRRFYYYLYSMERLGMLTGAESFGARAWYDEGSRMLLDAQKPDGSWDSEDAVTGSPVEDTCFAILFLRRATRPFVESKDRFQK